MKHHDFKMNALLVLLTLCTVAPLFCRGNPVPAGRLQCEEIQIDLCKSLPYNRTRLPNKYGEDTQSSVNSTLWNLAQRINGVICSKDLIFFVCSLYLPICVESQAIMKPIKPCRSVCEKVRSDCQAVVKSIAGVESPFLAFPEFECENLEVYERGVCLTPKAFARPTSPDSEATTSAGRDIRKADFLKAGFDFAIKGTISSMNKISNGYAIRLIVSRVILKNGYSFRSNVAQIWSPGNCTSDNAAPHTCLETGKEHVILGHKSTTKGLTMGWALALPQDKHLMDKLKTWKAEWASKHSKN